MSKNIEGHPPVSLPVSWTQFHISHEIRNGFLSSTSYMLYTIHLRLDVFFLFPTSLSRMLLFFVWIRRKPKRYKYVLVDEYSSSYILPSLSIYHHSFTAVVFCTFIYFKTLIRDKIFSGLLQLAIFSLCTGYVMAVNS